MHKTNFLNIISERGILNQCSDLENIEILAKQLHAKFSVTEFDNEVWLNEIKVPKKYRRHGIATTLIIFLKDYCTNQNKVLKLLMLPGDGITKYQLKKFYLGLGFKQYQEGRNKKDYLKWEKQNEEC